MKIELQDAGGDKICTKSNIATRGPFLLIFKQIHLILTKSAPKLSKMHPIIAYLDLIVANFTYIFTILSNIRPLLGYYSFK